MEEDMVGRRAKVRGYWLMLALVGLFGMFTAKSTNTLKFNHIPGRVYARGGGTASSLSQRDRIETIAAETRCDDTSLASADLPAPPVSAQTPQEFVRRRTVAIPASSPDLWPPTLLFRPPPALSVA